MSYAKVIVPVRAGSTDTVFDYIVPETIRGRIGPGSLVVVPFRNQVLTGCVLDLMRSSVEATREILSALPERLWLSQETVGLIEWIADECLCPTGAALKTVLMGGSAVRRRSTYTIDDEPEAARSRSQRQVARLLGPGWRQNLSALVDSGIVKKHTVYSARLDTSARNQIAATTDQAWAYPDRPDLTEEQASATAALASQGRYLLFGVTGSGKTEIYMREVEKHLSMGHGSIVLIPEISLTPQTVARFRRRFGQQVALLHSGLSAGERFSEWRRLKQGEALVAVGARSAVFAPVKNLALVVIDEEHDKAYKQEEDPKYHARQIAERRSPNVILGSATPSVESYFRAGSGEYKLLRMQKRVGDAGLPDCSVVDMRQELENGNRTMFSRELHESLEQTLKTGKQAILFLNRRGHSTFVMCRECGHVIKCPWCDVSAVYHATGQRLMCHYCSWTQKVPEICPACGSRYIRHFGAGTERIEMEVKAQFPGARVLRMDWDTTRKKGSYEAILSAFRDGRADVLVGTQMVSKGHDIPGVTTVGIVSADVTLNLPDFRSAERTFQLIAQVAGRAGRGVHKGRVIIQTYSPEHYAVSCAATLDYDRFYEMEVVSRRELGYPPFGHLLGITIRGKSAEECLSTGQQVVTHLSQSELGKEIEVLGPAPQAVSRIKRVHRWQVLVKASFRPHIREAALLVRHYLKDRVALDPNPENVI